MTQTARRGRGRPRKVLTDTQLAVLDALAAAHCTQAEIAAWLSTMRTKDGDPDGPTVSVDLLQRNFAARIKDGNALGRVSLRRAQMKAALGGNVVMQIWLGKQLLEQRDRVERWQDFNSLSDEELERIARDRA